MSNVRTGRRIGEERRGAAAVHDGEPPSVIRDHGFEELYQRRYVSMVRLAMLLVDRVEVAEDVAQEAFATVYRRWEDLDSPEAYLRLSVVNASRDQLRRRRVRERHTPDSAIARDAPDEMADAISALPANQRTALVLRFYEDLTIEQIAEVMHTRPGTVKSWLHRGLARLRKVIEQ